ncbi:hypothetical protein [uncultured Polaribacter sp.]|uniref:hypothetical protein n=1 Tax=uncultured Polaribacter sp. TaxID=174711 RepID=UPI002608E0C3|nr:hypothetical protein [uncultured Polaribacter sp.]
MIIFSNLIVAPTVISLVDCNHEISVLLDMNEEEEKGKGKESTKDLEIKIQQTEHNCSFLLREIQKNKNLRFLSKNYISKYPKIFTPPPEFIS